MEVMMTKLELVKKMAYLESVNDHLATELQQADILMRQVGFTDGLATVKSTALALKNGEIPEYDPDLFE